MLFSYLNLPQIPPELEQKCLDNIELIDRDTRLNELNKKEGIGHSITYLPAEAKVWLLDNILKPYFNPIPKDMLEKTMLHVSHYIKHTEGTGVHPIHFDYGRNFALNYIISPGGENVSTFWTDETKENILEEVVIEPRRWHLLRVKPDLHGVRGIRVNKLRALVSISYSPADLENFKAEEYFKEILE